MKPQKLILCGWGPYKDETVIDFTKLNTELFLITGQTGAGKTTLFDAIAYALYGTLSGEVREKGTVRSDFADENTATFVELYMTHKGEAYHIVRNPEYMRPKKKKGGENTFTKEKENAAVTLPDGSMIAGNQDVTAKMEEVLGLDSRQFRQISMIAQGEFARMLLASPSEKTAIFRELFGTGIYASVQNGLKDRSARLYRDYMNYRHKMEEDVALLFLQEEAWVNMISHAQPDYEEIEKYLTGCLEALKEKTHNLQKEDEQSQKNLLKLKEELTKARELNKRFDELEAGKLRVEELEGRQDIYRKQLTEMYSQCLKEIKAWDAFYTQKEDIRDAFALRMQRKENAQAIAQISQKIKQNNELLAKAQEEYLSAQKYFEEAKKRYEEADKIYKNAVIGIAAGYVEEGKPCPVCGSLEHPKVAELAKEVPDEKQLEYLQQKMEEARESLAKVYERALRHKNDGQVLGENLEGLRAKEEELVKREEALSKDIKGYIESVTQDDFEKNFLSYVKSQSKLEAIQKQTGIPVAKCTKQDAADIKAKTVFSADALTELEVLAKKVTEGHEKLLAAKEVLVHLKASLKGKKRLEQAAIEQVFLEKQKEAGNIRNVLHKELAQAKQVERSLLGICKNRREAENIRAEYGIVKDLDELANGNNARRLVFEQFVLAGYFEQILKAANLRLFEMTDGRYELIRAKQVSDGRRKDNLEILVMDYYTGKERSVKTLSGGETFKASLALALGMSDCIQARNGGTTVETLFIDEGFGALDEESLEQSCSVLQSLAGSNRMIGIISHVPELRERIESQIIIEKKNYGSSVTVRA